MTLKELKFALRLIAAIETSRDEPAFMGTPERWLENPKWRCTDDHISTRILKTETHGDLCLGCQSPAFLTFPEDEEGPLNYQYGRTACVV